MLYLCIEQKSNQMKFISQQELEKMVGKVCTAMGTCGMTKDKKVTGIFMIECGDGEPIIQEQSGRLCSINKNTLELIDLYTVWVGGVEVNDFHLPKDKADVLVKKYVDMGYDDVIVDKIT